MSVNENKKIEQNERLEKVKKIVEIIDEDKDEARKIINILIASYDIPKESF
ncbi:hypothetical protein [Aliarcobacter butzleri]|uniref:hypothetical protein n=1 Tax=Aliarcobacter butzleri TaxID=28197 RepID=UPI0021B6217E|nr:hypothetical protein [Aliarcobacter butzleri]MCT7637046.1 hypothetical protein [Aliarcobacter butzleri]